MTASIDRQTFVDRKARTANKGFASGGLKCKIPTFVHLKNFCTLAKHLCIKTRPNAKPQTVSCNCKTTRTK